MSCVGQDLQPLSYTVHDDDDDDDGYVIQNPSANILPTSHYCFLLVTFVTATYVCFTNLISNYLGRVLV